MVVVVLVVAVVVVAWTVQRHACTAFRHRPHGCWSCCVCWTRAPSTSTRQASFSHSRCVRGPALGEETLRQLRQRVRVVVVVCFGEDLLSRLSLVLLLLLLSSLLLLLLLLLWLLLWLLLVLLWRWCCNCE